MRNSASRRSCRRTGTRTSRCGSQVESGGCHGFQYLMSLTTLPSTGASALEAEQVAPDVTPSTTTSDTPSRPALNEDDTIFAFAPDDDSPAAAASSPALTSPKPRAGPAEPRAPQGQQGRLHDGADRQPVQDRRQPAGDEQLRLRDEFRHQGLKASAPNSSHHAISRCFEMIRHPLL
ncbi:hypothetical protein NUW58_g7439 [Xylaria curta]|uniref:Uncharacterized protein n=1 Tax=Xylaria curta TaxID=42375 RepID=A0ACC1NJ37_9PEZI|nr:hypothetical protein NUW58_g7439 [Xylaria curta]